MKLSCLILFLVIPVCAVKAQELTYYGDIEEIIIANCAPCHQPNGYAPFSLTTYEEVKKKATFIAHVTKSRYMPPWKADPTFRSFKNERVLSQEQIDAIAQWVASGSAKGKKKNRKDIQIPPIGTDRNPDLVLKMKAPYALSDQAIEDFRFFHIPTGLEKDRYLTSVEFVPGNRRHVHHSRIMTDTSNLMAGINGVEASDPVVAEYQKIPLTDEFLYGWVPGNLPVEYPAGTGKRIYADTDLILNVHYSPASSTELDQSEIRLYFAKDSVNKEVKTLAIKEEDISNQPFIIPAGASPTFYVSYTIRKDIKIISILPHMHYLGKSFKAMVATPSGEAIPLIKIDEWDFNWQSTYLLNEPLQIPAGSVILITASYDNTIKNPANPNHPPKDVGYGWGSTDEMMNLVIYYVDSK